MTSTHLRVSLPGAQDERLIPERPNAAQLALPSCRLVALDSDIILGDGARSLPFLLAQRWNRRCDPAAAKRALGLVL